MDFWNLGRKNFGWMDVPGVKAQHGLVTNAEDICNLAAKSIIKVSGGTDFKWQD
jgi:hypothetical protein